MRAILLAAGRARRLGPLGAGRPKCLLPLGGRTLIERLIDGLSAAGVDEATVVIGYREEQLRGALGEVCSEIRIRYRHNPEYERGAVLSLWAAREDLVGDVLIMDADVLCPAEMLRRLVDSPHPNCFLLDARVIPSGEEMMLMVEGDRVVDIGRSVRCEYDLVGESVGFLKVCGRDVERLRDVLERRVVQGDWDIEHEETFPEFLGLCPVGYERVDDLPWTEIDFPDDVERAEKEILPRIEGREGR